MSASRARIVQELTPVIADLGADLEDLEVAKAGRRSVVRVVVDKDGGVSLDDVADVSRAISEALDELDAREPQLLAGAYVLEVSSPGVDRPLLEPRHWRRNAGRLVTAHLRDGDPVTGRVVSADDQQVVLAVDGSERVLELAGVVRGQVQVEFSRVEDAADGVVEDEEPT